MSGDHRKVVIVHGAWGHPCENWLPWLTDELSAIGVEVIVPWFPTPEGQHIDTWRAVFESEVGQLGEDVVLVGHSLGCAFILRMLERSSSAVKGTFLTAGFLGELGIQEFDSCNASFVVGGYDWGKIRANAGRVFVYHSDNDPYVPLEKGVALANGLGSEVILVEGAGHFNVEAGYTRFERLLEDMAVLWEIGAANSST